MKTGAFIIPTGIGASIGGYAGDASFWAREFSKKYNLIVNPNVVNAACFSGITDNMLYVEGASLDDFFRGNLCLIPSKSNKIGVIFDKEIPLRVLNVHVNTINAVKTVYGCNIIGWEITDAPVGIDFYINENKTNSTGTVKNADTLLSAAEKLIKHGAEAIAVVCRFREEDDEKDYSSGNGIDPVGGVEAIISHIISEEFKVPAAHSPAFDDLTISTDIVNPKCAAEYITPTFLPCILLGLSQAPKLSQNEGLSINDLKFLIMPHDSLGCVPVIECIKRGITVFAVKENKTALDVTVEGLNLQSKHVIMVNKYEDLLEIKL